MRLKSDLAESRRLRDENARLRRLLAEHGIPIPVTSLDNKAPAPTGAPLGDRTIVSGKAEQRIALFRSLFRGREDVYAVRWESPDGRSGYAPKADRDWKAYLDAKAADRKKVERCESNTRSISLWILPVPVESQPEPSWGMATDFFTGLSDRGLKGLLCHCRHPP